MKRIDVLYFDGCPNHEPAVALVLDVVRDLGLDVEVKEIEVKGPEDAGRLHFLGSPTLQIDGVDVEPDARNRTDFGFACRTYDGEGLPRREMLVAALEDEDSMLGIGPGDVRDDVHGCCASEDVDQTQVDTLGRSKRRGVWAAGGAFAAAVVSSACCWLPLFLITVGVSAGGVGVMFERTRPIFLGLAAALLALGFYFTYFRKEQCEPGSACETPSPRLKRFNRMVLWIATVGAVAFAFFPSYVGVFQPARAVVVTNGTETAGAIVSLEVDGMSCEGCAVTLHNELLKVPGVQDATVEFEEGRALVSVSALAPPSIEWLIAAVEKAGYKGSLTRP